MYPGVVYGNPLFVNASAGDYGLSDYSPCIGTGTATGAPSADINGNPRPNPAGTSPDMGAYENVLGEPIPRTFFTVKTDGTGDYTTIQAAIDGVNNGDTVSVVAGTYVENLDYSGKNIVVKSQNGPSLTIIQPSNNLQPIVYIAWRHHGFFGVGAFFGGGGGAGFTYFLVLPLLR